jgi:hypothetical protein
MAEAEEPIIVDTAPAEVTVEVASEPSQEGRPQLSDEEVEKLAEPPADDEIGHYAKEAQRRIKSLRTAGQEWRRRVLQANKDLATATTLAEQLYRENRQLKDDRGRSETALIEQAVERVTAQLAQAKDRARAAHAAGNADEIVGATEQVARCAAELDRLHLLKPPPGRAEAREDAPPQPAPPAAPPPVSPGVEAWIRRNPWFGKDGEEEMSNFAMGVHQALEKQGIREPGNPEVYWGTIDRRLREKFPERFPAADKDKDKDKAEPGEGRRPVAVAGATRVNGGASPRGPRHVTLSESQVRLAKNLGLTPEQYAAQLVKEGKEKL